MDMSGDTAEMAGPIESFANSHGGIISELENLGGLPALLEPVLRARDIAQRALAFFHEALFEHHLDEERELFPVVLANAEPGAEREEVESMIHRLVDQHRDLESLWKRIEPGLRRLSGGRAEDLGVEDILQLIGRYRDHAGFEESMFLPRASAILGRKAHQLEALGLSLHMRHALKRIPAYI